MFARFSLWQSIQWAMVVVWLMCVSYVPSAQAQSGSATLSGAVSDESGGVVPGVSITLLHSATALRRDVVTSDQGFFILALLQPGRYELRAQLIGFRPIQMENIILNVNDQVAINIRLKVAPVGDTVTVLAEPSQITTSSALSTVVDRQFVENLPLNGRSFQSLLTLTPGVVFTGQSSSGLGQFSVNGQRTNANYFMVDGVGANVEAGGAFWPGQEAAGVTPALNAIGGTQSLVSVDALEEFSIQTSTYSAQFGRQPGGQISLVTRSGTNQFHGSLFEYFRDDAMDAVDWFVKANNLPRAPLHQNQFGGTLGGPLRVPGYDGRNRTFFFLSYEGLRLLQPRTIQNDMPSLSLREEAWPALEPLLASLPIPTGPENPATRQAPFVAAYSAPSSFDATSMRVDHHLSPAARLFGRFSYSPSQATTRNLNNVTSDSVDLRTTTIGLTQIFGSTITHELRFNETNNKRPFETWQDSIGGATPISPDALRPPGISPSTPVRLQIHLYGIASPYYTVGQFQRQRQFNVVDTWTWARGSHLLNFGADYRELRPASQPWEYFYFLQFNLPALLSGVPSGGTIQALERVDFRFRNLGAFLDDTWRVSPRLTLNLGLRWDINPAPTLAGGKTFTTVTGFDRPETLRLAPAGTPLYPTDYGALAPRLGAAYIISQREGREQTVRGGVGLFHDIGGGEAARVAISYPYLRTKPRPAVPYPFDAAAVAPPPLTSANPPYDGQTFIAFPDHQTPHTYEWNVTLDQSLGRSQSVTVSYVGATGRHLLRRELYDLRNANPDFTGTTRVDVSRSNASSDYAGLQLQYRRRLSRGLQVLGSYSLSNAEDTISNAVVTTQGRSDVLPPELFRGPADFDRRHVLSAAVTYVLPATSSGRMAAIVRDWSLSAILQMQSASPVNVVVQRDLGFGSIEVRPDLVPGVPIYLDDPTAPGGRRINPAAFSIPSEPRMGDLPRNALRGFPLRQIDFSLARSIPLASGLKLQLRADLFNVFNTANFANPANILGNLSGGMYSPYSSFGVPSSTLDNVFGGINGLYRLYAAGGPRSVQLSGRLTF